MKPNSKYAVIGLGQFGAQVAKNIAAKGAEVLAIDRNIDKIERIKDDVTYAVALDSTDIKALQSQNIQDMDAVLVAIGENIEAMLITVVLLTELKVQRILARAINQEQQIILKKIGIEEIVSPEENMGNLTAESLLHPTIKSFLELANSYRVVELKSPRQVYQKRVDEIDFEGNYNLKLISISRQFDRVEDGFLGTQDYYLLQHISIATQIEAGDILVLLGKIEDIEHFINSNE